MHLKVVATTCCALVFHLLSFQAEGFTAPISTAKASRNKELRSSLQEARVLERTDGNPLNGNVNGVSITTGSISATRPTSNQEEEPFTWTQQWYPVLPESYLHSDKPTPITVLGRDLVLWKAQKEDGKTVLSVLDDSCPHRRAPLSTGKIVGRNQLACRYHGWEFDASGSCTKIPMDATQKYTHKFCSQSYPAQVKGGLVWIFMDPNVATPPLIPQAIVDEENSKGWMMYKSPVSFLSQIENSFDPTHAPFTHEGKNVFAFFSPDTAIPMERYELTEPLTKRGFALEHTPYQQSAPGTPAETMTTTRQFVAPCTSVTKSPFFSANLHFVPSKAGETIVLVKFGGGNNGKKKNHLLSRVLPRRFQNAVKDFIHFWFQLSNDRHKFLMQDQINMQGQDARKAKDQKWEDMTPTPSDAGVKAFQRWVRRFGDSGPFPLAEVGVQSGKELSMWESHGKYCQQCQAALKRLARAEKVTKRISSVSIVASLIGAAVSSLAKGSARSSASLLVAFSLLFLSVASRALSQSCARLMERSFVTRETDAHLQTMEIYPN